MLNEDFIQGHIDMAVFCGWEPQKKNEEFPNGYLLMSLDNEIETVSVDKILEELPYGSDWNYLMVAWKNLKSVTKEDTDLYSTEESNQMDEIWNRVSQYLEDVDIELAFIEVVSGIRFYNALKTKETI